MSSELGHYIVAGSCWLQRLALAATPVWDHLSAADDRIARRAARQASTLIAVFGTFHIPRAYLFVDQVTGIPNSAHLAMNLTAVLGTWVYQPWLDASEGWVPSPPQRALRHTLALATGGGLMGLFALAHRSGLDTSEPGDFTLRYGATPYILAYTTLSHGYIGANQLRVIRHHLSFWGSDHLAADPNLRLRARLITSAFAAGVAYNGVEIAKALLVRLRVPIPANLALYGTLLPIAALNALVLLAIPLFKVVSWLMHYYLHQRLYHLRQTLVAANPDLLCEPVRFRVLDALPVNGQGPIELRLRQRVKEIWDGIATLYPYRDARIAARALYRREGVADVDTTLHIEAALLEGALRARAEGRPAPPPIPPIAGPADPTLLGQAVYLHRLSQALGSRIIHAASCPPPPPLNRSADGIYIPDVEDYVGFIGASV